MEEINKEAFDILKKEYFNTTSKDCNISSYFNQYDITRNSNIYEVYDNKNNEDFDLSSDEILNLFKLLRSGLEHLATWRWIESDSWE